jgi:hypothetical protein
MKQMQGQGILQMIFPLILNVGSPEAAWCFLRLQCFFLFQMLKLWPKSKDKLIYTFFHVVVLRSRAFVISGGARFRIKRKERQLCKRLYSP